MHHRLTLAAAAALVALLAFAGAAGAAQRGDLDPSFGNAGRQIVELGFPGAQINAAAVQADGKTVLVGSTEGYGDGSDFLVARLDADGSLDQTFGTDGIETTDFEGFQDVAQGVAIDPEGKIVVVGSESTESGSGHRDWAIARYDADGRPDPSFAEGGKAIIDFGGGGSQGALTVAFQADGKILVGGNANPFEYEIAFGIARLEADGEPDPSFGEGGLRTTKLPSGYGSVSQIAPGPQGKVLVLGYIGNGGAFEIALARYDADGRLDTTFAGEGIATTQFTPGGTSEPKGMMVLPDGKILVAGTTGIEFGGFHLLLARYEADGELDPTFAEAGVAEPEFPAEGELSIPSESFAASGLGVAPDGTAFIAGTFRTFEESFTVEHSDLAVAAFAPDGTPDTGFSGDGKETIRTTGFKSNAIATALDPQGRLVLVGTVANETESHLSALRLFGLEPPAVAPAPPTAKAPPATIAPPPAIHPRRRVTCVRARAGSKAAADRLDLAAGRLRAAGAKAAHAKGPRKSAARRVLRRARTRFENSKRNRDRARRKAAARC
jgi:uncharacterized delta-60 repeat protein